MAKQSKADIASPKNEVAPLASDRMTLFRAINSLISERMRVANLYGESFDGKRNMYTQCGYKQDLVYEDYEKMYLRGDIARTIITAYPNATWVKPPVIREMEKDNKGNAKSRNNWDNDSTPFEQALNSLFRKLPLYTNFRRADILCGIGQYGGLFLGFEDGTDLASPVAKGSKLVFTKALPQKYLSVQKYVDDITSKRYGLPEVYQIQFVDEQVLSVVTPGSVTKVTQGMSVHWSRVIHIADNKDCSDVVGTPRLQCIFNRLFDLDKILGCSGEMFWQGAFQGISFETDAGAMITDQASLETEIENYVHGLQRYLKLQGVQAKTLSSTVASPKTNVDCILLILSAASRIPLRILTGSERGELASVQDENNWKDRIDERRRDFATNEILMPFIDRLVEFQVIPSPKSDPKDYVIEWSDISATTYKQQMETSRIITDSLRMYIADKIYLLMPPEQYLEKIMRFSPEQIKFFGPFDIETLKKIMGDFPKTPEQVNGLGNAGSSKKGDKNNGVTRRSNGQGTRVDIPQERRIVG